jgi:hypothetical protein
MTPTLLKFCHPRSRFSSFSRQVLLGCTFTLSRIVTLSHTWSRSHSWPRLVSLYHERSHLAVVSHFSHVRSCFFTYGHSFWGWDLVSELLSWTDIWSLLRLVTFNHASIPFFSPYYSCLYHVVLGCASHFVMRFHALSRVILSGHALLLFHTTNILVHVS